MPAKPDTSPYSPAFVEWVESVRSEFGGPDVVDFVSIVLNVLASMRGALFYEELHKLMHEMLMYVEEILQERGDIVAEHWRNMDGGYEMYVAAHAQPVPDDISGLVDTLPDDYDLRD